MYLNNIQNNILVNYQHLQKYIATVHQDANIKIKNKNKMHTSYNGLVFLSSKQEMRVRIPPHAKIFIIIKFNLKYIYILYKLTLKLKTNTLIIPILYIIKA